MVDIMETKLDFLSNCCCLFWDLMLNKLYILHLKNCFLKKWGKIDYRHTHNIFVFLKMKTLRGLCQTSVEGQPTTVGIKMEENVFVEKYSDFC